MLAGESVRVLVTVEPAQPPPRDTEAMAASMVAEETSDMTGAV